MSNIQTAVIHPSSLSAAGSAFLNSKLEQADCFSFLRLGDGELRYLLEVQQLGAARDYLTAQDAPISCEYASGGPRLTSTYYDRLKLAYENCSLVDTYLTVPYNAQNFAKLLWDRPGEPSLEVPQDFQGRIVLDWLLIDAKRYFQRHKCLICCAEASLLRELLRDERYYAVGGLIFDPVCLPYFYQPPNDGSRLSEDLESIKQELSKLVHQLEIDTVLLGLGGAAKILAHELSTELGIRVVDVGAPLRGLTYSATVGYATWRANHHVHFGRIPLEVYMTALCRAYPMMDAKTKLVKAHAQMRICFQRKKLYSSTACELSNGGEVDETPSAYRDFAEDHSYYTKNILPEVVRSKEVDSLLLEFRNWKRKRKIGISGRAFNFLIQTKSVYRSMRNWFKTK